MEYFAGLDVSMEETHICVLDREGVLIREGKTATSPKAISDFLAVGPECKGDWQDGPDALSRPC